MFCIYLHTFCSVNFTHTLLVQTHTQNVSASWNLSLQLLSFVLSNLTPCRNMFVNFLNTSMLLSRGVFRGGYGGSLPSWISEIYAFGGVLAYAYASLNIFKTMSSSQTLLNLSKYKIEDQEIYFEDLHFSFSQILHSLFNR